MERYNHFLEQVAASFEEDRAAVIREALCFAAEKLAGRTRYNGAPLLDHSVGVAEIILSHLGAGFNSVVATLLHDLVRMDLAALDEIGAKYGREVATIIDGMTNISHIHPKTSDAQAENFRELIISYSTDPRVILIKLADRLEVMRTLDIFPHAKQAKKAWESLNIYAKIAHKLGLYPIKSELEDLALKYLEPADYAHIVEKLESGAAEREKFIERFLVPINEKLSATNLKYHIKSRTKSIYSIWNKMRASRIPFEEVYDLFAIRIIVDCPREEEKTACWNVFSLITDFYTPNPERLRDWISIPKSNGYESLHTTVVAPEGKWVEIQIRSERMDAVAERGIAAHWRYKGVKGGRMGAEEWLARLRELIENTDTSGSALSQKFYDKIQLGEIFVFTPGGDLRRLPEGATILDFAFQVHTDIGTNCVGGKVNGKNVPIRYLLRNGDIVQILTSKNQRPKPDWLSIAKTTRARNKIRAYLREQEAEAAILGREELERKIKNWKLPLSIDEAVTALCKRFRVRTGTEMYGRIADGSIEITREFLTGVVEPPQGSEKMFERPSERAAERVGDGAGVGAGAQGVAGASDALIIIDRSPTSFVYKLGKCCNPAPGDDIFAFVTVSAGITIHRRDCPNAQRMRTLYPYRILPAQWK